MTQQTSIFLQFCGILYRLDAHKVTTGVAINYIIHIDEHDTLYEKTGIKSVIFQYSLFDKKFLHPSVSYRHYRPGIIVPNYPFDMAVIRGTQMYEGVYKVLETLDEKKQSKLKE
ncbi:MAG: hypothetical protein INR73_15230 [Williamsia sp.]|nr:hypothetical protein [Williamsia sp.]